MRKNDLRTAIGGIRAREELVTDTMDKIARYRTEQCESRGDSRRSFGLGLRIAAAACAFALVVGIGVAMSLGGNVPDTISDTDDMRNIDNDQNIDITDPPSSQQKLDELSELAKDLDGDWMIVSATVDSVDSCRMTEEGLAAVGLTVNDSFDHSQGFEFDGENITAEFSAQSQAELDSLIESLTSQRYFLLSFDTESGEDCWTIEKYL